MRRVITALLLALGLAGCGGELVTLLTGGSGGCFPGPQTGIRGVLVADPRSGTAVKSSTGGLELVMWPPGYTGRRTFFGEVEVLDTSGRVVATTGRKVALPRQALNETAEILYGAFPACAGVELP